MGCWTLSRFYFRWMAVLYPAARVVQPFHHRLITTTHENCVLIVLCYFIYSPFSASGAFYFALAYPGSNLLELARLLQLTHLRQAVRWGWLDASKACTIYIFIYIYGVYAVFLTGKSLNVRSCTVRIYGSGQPCLHTLYPGWMLG